MEKLYLFIALIVLSITSSFLYTGCSEEDPLIPPEEHFEVEGLLLYDAAFNIVFEVYRGQTNDTLFVPQGALTDAFIIKFYDSEKNVINPPDDLDLRFGWEIANIAIVEVFQHPGEEGEYKFHLRGFQEGLTTIELKLLHGDHPDFTTPPIPVLVFHSDTAHGEAAGFRLEDEETADTLVIVNVDGSITDSLNLALNDTTDHIEVVFFDENGNEFQPSYPEHALNITIGDLNIADFIAPSQQEPWAFNLIGKNVGFSSITLGILHNGDVEKTFTLIPIEVR